MIVRKAYSRLSYHDKEGERVKLRLQDSGEVLRGSWWYAGEDTSTKGLR